MTISHLFSKRSLFYVSLLILFTFISTFVGGYRFTDQYASPKHYYFLFTALITLIPYIFIKLLQTKPSNTLRVNTLDIAIAAFIVYITISCYTANGNIFNNTKYSNILISGLYYYLIRSIYSDFKLSIDFGSRFFLILTFILLVHTVIGLFQYLNIIDFPGAKFRVTGLWGNPGPFTNFIVLLIPIGISGLFFHNSHKSRILYFTALSISFMVIPLTDARTAWIAGIIGLFYVIANHELIWNKIRDLLSNPLKKVISVILLFFILIAFILFLKSINVNSASGRLFIWKVSATMIKEKPLLGHGFDKYTSVHNDFQAEYFKENPNDKKSVMLADNVTHAFNE